MTKLLTTLSILLVATAAHTKGEIYPQADFKVELPIGKTTKTKLKNTYTVELVIDGDTLKLTNGERVHLIGIDTPESKPNAKAKKDAERTGQDLETITKMGQQAKEFLEDFLPVGTKVNLEFDVQKRDKYGRLLAYVEVDGNDIQLPQDDDRYHFYTMHWDYPTIYVNGTILLSGYAQPMTIPPNVKYADLFQELYNEAREQGWGLWRNNDNKQVDIILQKDGNAIPLDLETKDFVKNLMENIISQCWIEWEGSVGSWTKNFSENHLRIRYATSIILERPNGEIKVSEILLSLPEGTFPGSFLTKYKEEIRGFSKCGGFETLKLVCANDTIKANIPKGYYINCKVYEKNVNDRKAAGKVNDLSPNE